MPTAPDNPHLELGDHSGHDDEPYSDVNAAKDLYGPDPFDEDNTNPDNYWCPISDDDDGPHAAPCPPAPHPVEEGNHLHKERIQLNAVRKFL